VVTWDLSGRGEPGIDRAMPPPLVEFQSVSLGYGGLVILSDLTFTLETGDFLAFVGPNGAGKTTLLRAISGILPPSRGRVVRPRPIAIGYVPQERDLDPVFPLSAFEVALQGRTARLGPWRHPGPPDREIAWRVLAQADVAGLAPIAFRELSGGQKQRVLIARALASEPGLIVLDEPTAGMDPAAEHALMALLRRLHQDQGLTLVMATHNLNLVGNYATRVALVDWERRLFRLGARGEILRDEVLTALYARPMRVREIEGWRVVFAGGGLC
jgi:ABC-type Mn2+/Zn2+ transport system ATPase subunit